MHASRIALVLVPAAILTGSMLTRGGGTLPGSSSIALDSARQAPSCTSCHSGTIGANNTTTTLSAPQHSLDLGETIQVALQVSGGPSGTDGGFAAENSGGTFGSSATVQVNSSGRAGQFASHVNDQSRSWSWPYTAPQTPGLVRMFAVGMAANGSGTSGDTIAFHGANGSATQSTPVYIGVNAAGNQRFGQGCVGSFGNWAVLYSDAVPTVGNQSYSVKLAGAAPSSPALFLFGIPRAVPLDLGLIGIQGCQMWVDSVVDAVVATSAGNVQRAEGTASVPAPIPNDPSLQGASLGVQSAIVDIPNGRTLALTVTNGLRITIQ